MTKEKQGTDKTGASARDRKSESKPSSGNRPTPGPLKSEDSTGINPQKERPIDPKMLHMPPD
jgi:hypothetical protein